MADNVEQMGFSPIFDDNSKVLILGSFPSVKSRNINFYYGHPQNRFWKTLQSIFGGDISTVEGKRQLCLQNKIALWDIVSTCNIVGSMDVDIKNPTFVDLSQVLDNADIQVIICNGKSAFNFTQKAYSGALPVVCLPSTSPANARFDEKIWQQTLSKYLTTKKE